MKKARPAGFFFASELCPIIGNTAVTANRV